MKSMEQKLKALANERRLQIIRLLNNHKSGEATVGEIADKIKLSFRATSRHLKILELAEILKRDQRGLEAYYSLIDKRHPLLKLILTIG